VPIWLFAIVAVISTEAESCGEHVVGTIVPESALDQGSTFTARLPCGAEEVT